MGEFKNDFHHLELSVVELRGRGECVQFTTSDILFKYPDLPDPQFHFCKMNEEDNINSMSIY